MKVRLSSSLNHQSMNLSSVPKFMPPRQMRDTHRPVSPSRAYSMPVDSSVFVSDAIVVVVMRETRNLQGKMQTHKP